MPDLKPRREPVPEQRAAIDDRGGDLFLSAAAGTGKTRVLVERYCDVVCAREGPEAAVGIDGVLAFTFTDRAAGELRSRVRAELRRRAEAAPSGAEASRLRALARQADSAWVSTIHSFCRRLLAGHPLAAGLDPRFTVLDQVEARRLAELAFDRAFTRFGEDPDPERFEMAAGFDVKALRSMISTAHDGLRSRGHDHARLPEAERPDLREAVEELRSAATAALEATAEATHRGGIDKREQIAEAAALAHDPEPTEDDLDRLYFKNGGQVFQCPEIERYHAARAALERRVLERRFAHHYDYVRELVELYGEEYDALKRGRSALDFEDLQLAARRLLRVRPDLRRRLGGRFAHVMVDEFQDTNRLQLSLIRLLHLDERGEPVNRLFTVGDQFQSIYAFRHADLDVFRAEEHALAESPERGSVRRLLGSFRSRPEVIGPVNAVSGGLLGERFDRLRVGVDPAGAAFEGDSPPLAEVLVTEKDGWEEEGVDLEVSPDERAQLWRVAEARFLAGRLRELADEGFPRGDMVVLLRAYSHVDAYEQALEEAGLAPHVVGGRGYWSRQQVADLRALLLALANPLDDKALYGALSSPSCGISADALWLIARAREGAPAWSVVSSAWGGEPAGEESDWLAQAREWTAHVPDADVEALREFVATFLALRAALPRLGLEALIDRAMTDFGYDLALLARPGGRRRMANVRKLMRLARDFEAGEGRDLRGFLDFLADQDAAAAPEGEAALEAEGHDGVRVMTVHAAKGLEFPLVAVADLGRGLWGGQPPQLLLRPAEPGPGEGQEGLGMRVGLRLSRLGRSRKDMFEYAELQEIERELADEEERRILHVAMTRAEQRLILSGACKIDKLGDEQKPLSPLMPRVLRALGWDGEQSTVAVDAPEPREGLDAHFGPVTVGIRVARPTDERLGDAAGAKARLAEGPSRNGTGNGLAPLPHPDLQAPAAPVAPASVGRASYSALSQWESCGYRFYAERVLGMARRPPRSRAAAGGAAATEAVALPEAELEGLEHRHARGIVVHELLEASARGGWASPEPAGVAELLAREGVDAGPDAVERTAALVQGFLGSELLGSLRGARTLLPEVPFLFRLGGLVVRGEIDLLADLGDEVVVIDYKSDALGGREPADAMERYAGQRRLYGLAALRRHGRPVRVVHVFLERPDRPVEVRFEPAEAAALAAELETTAGEIVAGRFEVTDRPHRALCFDCPARERLCVHPPEMTMREEPTAPVAPVGSQLVLDLGGGV